MNRDRFPGLAGGWARLDGPAGTQMVDSAIDAMADFDPLDPYSRAIVLRAEREAIRLGVPASPRGRDALRVFLPGTARGRHGRTGRDGEDPSR